MIALILLLFVEVPVRIKIAIDHQRPEFEDRFTPLKSPPCTGDLHAILYQMTASPFDHTCSNRIALGQVVRIVEISRVIGQVGGTLINRLALCRVHAFGRRTTTEVTHDRLDLPLQQLNVLSPTHWATWGVSGGNQALAAFQRYSSTCMMSTMITTRTPKARAVCSISAIWVRSPSTNTNHSAWCMGSRRCPSAKPVAITVFIDFSRLAQSFFPTGLGATRQFWD